VSLKQQMLDVAAPTACEIESRLPELLNSPERHEILTLIVYTALMVFTETCDIQGFIEFPNPSDN
jgi:hypothetical protein